MRLLGSSDSLRRTGFGFTSLLFCPSSSKSQAQQQGPLTDTTGANFAVLAPEEVHGSGEEEAEEEEEEHEGNAPSIAEEKVQGISVSSANNKPSKLKQHENVPPKKVKPDDQDLDAILKDLNIRTDRCKAKGCKNSTNFTGFMCEFCKEMYCVQHMNPVFHGCVDAYRAKSQADLRQKMLKAQNSASAAFGQTSTQKLKPEQKEALKSKLHAKLEHTMEKRTSQKTKDKDSKTSKKKN